MERGKRRERKPKSNKANGSKKNPLRKKFDRDGHGSFVSRSPNGDPAMDAAANIFAHELAESCTDPHYDAWWDSISGLEAADRCNFRFGEFW